ncbi:hypothetical protein [Trichormus azollae]|uniref:hypothetical protein n=1 Tax=Trichormus azollae TaxID=1164 RepID=UPI001E470974|nr:hypothetical protein [Trichormus azollae]
MPVKYRLKFAFRRFMMWFTILNRVVVAFCKRRAIFGDAFVIVTFWRKQQSS